MKKHLSHTFFHTQPYRSWNAAATCQYTAKKQVFKTASFLCFPFCLDCYFLLSIY